MVSTLVSNIQNPIAIIAIGIVTSCIQMLGSIGLGALILKKITSNQIELRGNLHLYLGLGVGVQCLTLSILSLLKILYPTLLLVIFLLLFCSSLFFLKLYLHRSLKRRVYLIDKLKIVYAFLLLIPVLYVSSYCFIPSYGADIGIYHLVAVRDFLWDGGYAYNPFFYGAGIYKGWHIFGLPAFYVGGESAYLGLSVWTFIGLILLIRQMLNEFTDHSNKRLVDLISTIVGLVIVNFLLDSVPNNDIPATYLELILIYYFVINLRPKLEKSEYVDFRFYWWFINFH